MREFRKYGSVRGALRNERLYRDHGTSMGSASLSVQPEGQGRSEAPEVAWCSDILRRGGRDVKPRGPARLDSHTSSESYSMSRPSLCTESETDPAKMAPDTVIGAMAIGTRTRDTNWNDQAQTFYIALPSCDWMAAELDTTSQEAGAIIHGSCC